MNTFVHYLSQQRLSYADAAMIAGVPRCIIWRVVNNLNVSRETFFKIIKRLEFFTGVTYPQWF